MASRISLEILHILLSISLAYGSSAHADGSFLGIPQMPKVTSQVSRHIPSEAHRTLEMIQSSFSELSKGTSQKIQSKDEDGSNSAQADVTSDKKQVSMLQMERLKNPDAPRYSLYQAALDKIKEAIDTYKGRFGGSDSTNQLKVEKAGQKLEDTQNSLMQDKTIKEYFDKASKLLDRFGHTTRDPESKGGDSASNLIFPNEDVVEFKRTRAMLDSLLKTQEKTNKKVQEEKDQRKGAMEENTKYKEEVTDLFKLLRAVKEGVTDLGKQLSSWNEGVAENVKKEAAETLSKVETALGDDITKTPKGGEGSALESQKRVDKDYENAGNLLELLKMEIQDKQVECNSIAKSDQESCNEELQKKKKEYEDKQKEYGEAEK